MKNEARGPNRQSARRKQSSRAALEEGLRQRASEASLYNGLNGTAENVSPVRLNNGWYLNS